MSEIDKRLTAQRTLAGFTDFLDLGFRPAAHHRLLFDRLESVERGDIRNLMVLMPPGSAKSTYGSVIFPAWYMGRNPTSAMIAASHTGELSERFGRKVRNIVGSPEFRRVFDSGLSADSTAAARWDTDKGGEYFAAGVGGPITGRRADLGLIDDPVKNREDADSERVRNKTWDWYTNDFLTRLKPGARQILIMTRWHEDDLGGRILDRDGDEWHVVSIPMIAETNDPLGRAPGEMLWAEWFTTDMVERAQRDTRSWNALYQQQPAPDEGDYFKSEWFGEYDDAPQGLRIVGASDYAVTDGGGDYTEHGVAAWDGRNLFLLDWWRGQKASDEWIERQCDLIVQWRPSIWFGESGVIRRAIEPALRSRMQQRDALCQLEWLPSISDKEARARSIQAMASMGNVWLPKHAIWKSDLMGQLLKFPTGKFDDGVDTMSLFGRGLRQMGRPRTPVPRRQVQRGDGSSWMAA